MRLRESFELAGAAAEGGELGSHLSHTRRRRLEGVGGSSRDAGQTEEFHDAEPKRRCVASQNRSVVRGVD
jgi:hypothetical protein